MRKNNNQLGFSIIELLLAIALFAVMSSTIIALALSGYNALIKSYKQIIASSLVHEGLEATRGIKDYAWNEMVYSRSGISASGGFWQFVGEGTTEQINEFSRTIDFEDICRNSNYEIVDCASGWNDVQAKRVIVNVSWPLLYNQSQLTFFENEEILTNWDSYNWRQTDWSGGDGQVAWSDETKYLEQDGNVWINDAGEIKLQIYETVGNWTPSGGTVLTDTTDTDFNAGILTNVAVTGVGEPARVLLNSGAGWNARTESGLVTAENLQGVQYVSADEAWAVGGSGKILHYSNNQWTEYQDLGTQTIYALSMISTSSGWAVGDSGKFYRYNGTNWTETQDLNNFAIRTIKMVSESEGWAAGVSGQIYRYNGTSWSQFTDTGNQTWYSLDMVSSSDGWVAGNGGRIYRYNGSSWSQFTDTGKESWRTLKFLSPTDGWMAGDNGEIYHYDGSAWSQFMDTGNETWYSLDIVSSSDGWLAGSGGEIRRWNGANWNSVASDTTNDIYAINAWDANEALAVGASGLILGYSYGYLASGNIVSRVFDSGAANTTWDYVYWSENLPVGTDITLATRTGNTASPDGTWSAWSAEMTDSVSSVFPSPSGRYAQYRASLSTNGENTPELLSVGLSYGESTVRNLLDLSIVAANDVWAVGNAGTIIHYDGNSWTAFQDTGGNRVRTINMVSANDGWAAGDAGKIFRFNGTNWTEFQDTGGDTWYRLRMIDANNGWLVGNSGKIYRYDGTSWAQFVDTGNTNWYGLFVMDAGNAWVVGQSGTIYRYNGASWSEQMDLGNMNMNDVYMLSPTNGWAVGDGGTIARYNGVWSTVSSPTTQDLNGVAFISSSNGWAVGDNGVILRYDGVNWALIDSPVDYNLQTVAFSGENIGWVVGELGVVSAYGTAQIVPANGYLISSAYWMGTSSPLQVVEWNEDIPESCASCLVKLQVRVASDNVGVPGSWTDWYGPDGVGTYFTISKGEIAPKEFNWASWAQYKIEMQSDEINTPIVYDIIVNYK